MILSTAPRQWPTNTPRWKARASARPAAIISNLTCKVTGTLLYVAMSRWITDSGRIGYGLNMENYPLDMMARLRGRRWNSAPGNIDT